MKRRDELEDIARMPHGPKKKFLILTEFREELRAATTCNPAKLGCETLLAVLGVDTRLGAQRGPSIDPEREDDNANL